MTNTELIAGARKFLATPNFGKAMARELDNAMIYIRELADIAEAAEARVKGFEANFPCDGGCNYDSGPEESCSLHGRNPADLWGIIANISAERYEAEVRIAELEAGEWEYSWEGEDQASSWSLAQVFQRMEDAQRFGESTGGSWVKRDGGQMVRRHVGPWVPVESEGE
ncbi:MAG: hypothetical protein WC829_19935 [Hyphomicrobium sp.]|jgi:hypothetical protein